MAWNREQYIHNGKRFTIYYMGESFVVRTGDQEVAAGDFCEAPLARAKFVIERDFCKQLPADERPTLGECRVIDNREKRGGLHSRWPSQSKPASTS